jgi:hypothetical protein
MVRQREEGSELSSRDAIQRNDRRRDSHKHRIQSGRSRRIEGFWLQTGRAIKAFSCGGPATGLSEWVSVERGRRRMTSSNGRARGVRKGLKKKMVE